MDAYINTDGDIVNQNYVGYISDSYETEIEDESADSSEDEEMTEKLKRMRLGYHFFVDPRVFKMYPKDFFIMEQRERMIRIKEMEQDAIGLPAPKILDARKSERQDLMPIVCATAVVFKADLEDGVVADPFVKVLEDKGIETWVVPTLAYYMLVSPEMKRALNAPEMYAGLIFSNFKAVQTVKKNIDEFFGDEEQIQIMAAWHDKVNFSVDKTTADAAKDLLNIDTVGSDAGCLASLGKMIKETENIEGFKPYLFPCSFIGTEKYLHYVNEVLVETMPCYRTLTHPDLFESFKNIVLEIDGIPEYAVFFSPNGAKYANELLFGTKYELCMSKIIAIGAATDYHFREDGIVPIFASEPATPEAFAKELHKYLNPIVIEEKFVPKKKVIQRTPSILRFEEIVGDTFYECASKKRPEPKKKFEGRTKIKMYK